MIVSIIVALDEENGIGRDGRIPWYLPADLKRFKKLTYNHHLIMGRKTYESIGKPLPGRISLIISRNPNYIPPNRNKENCIVVSSISSALNIALTRGETEVFVIGGAQIYKQTLNLANRIYLTHIKSRFNCDTFFPCFDRSAWTEIENNHFEPDLNNQFSFSFITLIKKQEFSKNFH